MKHYLCLETQLAHKCIDCGQKLWLISQSYPPEETKHTLGCVDHGGASGKIIYVAFRFEDGICLDEIIDSHILPAFKRFFKPDKTEIRIN